MRDRYRRRRLIERVMFTVTCCATATALGVLLFLLGLDGRMALGTWQSVCLVDTNRDNPVRSVRLSFLAG